MASIMSFPNMNRPSFVIIVKSVVCLVTSAYEIILLLMSVVIHKVLLVTLKSSRPTSPVSLATTISTCQSSIKVFLRGINFLPSFFPVLC